MNMLLVSDEDGVDFKLRVKDVEPTAEEREQRWGRWNGPCPMRTAEEHAAEDHMRLRWIEVVEVIEPLHVIDKIDPDAEDLEGGPLWNELFEPICHVGARRPLIGRTLEAGEVCGNIDLLSEDGEIAIMDYV